MAGLSNTRVTTVAMWATFIVAVRLVDELREHSCNRPPSVIFDALLLLRPISAG